MPRKLRELIADLRRAGFVQIPGKGSHRKFRGPRGAFVVLSGHNLGVDAKRYQEEEVAAEIAKSRQP